MKKIMISGLVMAFLLVSASSLQAQSLYIGVQAGYHAQDLAVPTLEFDQGTSLFYGGQIGLNFMMFAVEATYIRSDYEIVQAAAGIVDWDGQTLAYQYVGANVKLIPISLAVFKLYLTAGYGTYTADIKTVDKESDWGLNYGAGIELRITKIGILFEGKYRPGEVEIEGATLDLGNYSFGVGINIYF
ncbi:MAG: outer membrane beta-barrel protein [Candidatus Aminicenantes bacterium]|jgi:hypothetical protein